MKNTKQKIQHPIRLKNTVFIRTVTHYYVGNIAIIDKDSLVLTGASWVAWPNEQHGEILATGRISDTQLIPHPVAIGRGAIIDMTDWLHELPERST